MKELALFIILLSLVLYYIGVESHILQFIASILGTILLYIEAKYK